MKRALLGAVSAVALCAAGGAAWGQAADQSGATNATNAKTGNNTVKEVVVTGIRNSLRNALRAKEQAKQIEEVLSAEDIGKLPDVSIGEALARLPGVATNRDRGDSTQISIRGMGPELVNTLMNGRELVSAEANRNIRYESFPAELISGASVYKTPTAGEPEGWVAGQIDMQTVRPLDYSTPVHMINLRGSFNDAAQSVKGANAFGAIGGASYIGQFFDHTLGVAIGYAGRYEPEATRRADIWSYGDSYLDATHQYCAAPGQCQNFAGNDYAPYGLSALARSGEGTRHGALATVQWKPGSNFQVVGDLFYSRLNYEEAQRGPQVSSLLYGNDFSSPTYSGGAIVSGSATNIEYPTYGPNAKYGQFASAANEFYSFTDTLWAGGLNTTWRNGPWKLTNDIGYSTTTRDSLYLEVFAYPTVNGQAVPSPVSWRSVPNGPPVLNFGSYSLSDPATTMIGTIDIPTNGGGAPITDDRLFSFRQDVQYDYESGFLHNLQLGVRYTNRRKDYTVRSQNLSPANPVAVPAQYLNSPTTFGGNGFNYPDTLSVNEDVANLFGGIHPVETVDDAAASWVVKENTLSAYVASDFGTQLLGRELVGNAGVRVVHTDETSSSAQVENDPSTNWVSVAKPISYNNAFTDVLPSLNLTWKIAHGQQIRFAAAKAVARAPLDSLNAGYSVYNSSGTTPAGYGGNPKLKPFKADQLDLSYEIYFNKDTALTIAGFYKKLDTYIVLQTTPTTIVSNGQQEQGTFQQPVNGSGGDIKGFEVMYTQAFTFLPGPWSGLGVYANYSLTDSSISFNQATNPIGNIPLPGLSRNVGNASVYYSKYGFETRIAYRYRSGYAANIAGDAFLLHNGAEGILDYEANYTFPWNSRFKGVTLQFQANNLTNAPFRTYFANQEQPGRYEVFGRRYWAGLTYKW